MSVVTAAVPVCSYCSGTGAKLFCSKCKIMRYCCKECQVTDWNKGHKALCKEICSGSISASDDSAIPTTFLPAATLWARKAIFYYGQLLNFSVQPLRNETEGFAITSNDTASASCSSAMDAIPIIISRLQTFLTMFYTHAKKTKQVTKPHHRGGFLLVESASLSLQELLSADVAEVEVAPSRDVMVHYFSRNRMVYYLKQFCVEKSLSLVDLLAHLKINEPTPIGQIPIITCFRGGYPSGAGVSPSDDITDLNLGAIPGPVSQADETEIFDKASSIYSATTDENASSSGDGGESAQIDLLTGKVVLFDIKRKHNSTVDDAKNSVAPGGLDPKWFSTAYNEFVVRNLVYLSSFAQDKYQSHGKGILFIFSRNCRLDLFVDQRLHPEIRSTDRQLLLIWVTENNPDSEYTTFKYVAKHVKNETYTEAHMKSIAEKCTVVLCPFVLYTDPSGDTLPSMFSQHLRTPTSNSEMCLDVGTSYLPIIDRTKLGTNAPPAMPADLTVLNLNIDRE